MANLLKQLANGVRLGNTNVFCKKDSHLTNKAGESFAIHGEKNDWDIR